jgi:hypothetical protein
MSTSRIRGMTQTYLPSRSHSKTLRYSKFSVQIYRAKRRSLASKRLSFCRSALEAFPLELSKSSPLLPSSLNSKMLVARLGARDCRSPPQTPLFNQLVSMVVLPLILRIVRQLFVPAHHQHASPLMLAFDVIRQDAHKRILPHPSDFLPFG